MTPRTSSKPSRRPSPKLKDSVTIVVCACNEAANLKPLLRLIEETFQILDFELPVLLINDGSSDQSLEILSELRADYAFLSVINHEQQMGLTQCLQTALSSTDTDWLYFSPADLESDPRIDLPRLIESYEPGVDAIAGWRQNRKDGKTLASKFANKTCHIMFGLTIHDMNWIKLVRREPLEKIPAGKVSHAFILPVMAALGYRVIETPTPWHSRKEGKSKFGSSRLMSSAIKFWKLWWWFYVVEKGFPEERQRGI